MVYVSEELSFLPFRLDVAWVSYGFLHLPALLENLGIKAPLPLPLAVAKDMVG